MKKLIFTAIVALVLLLQSCGVNNALVLNQNQNSTQVQLSHNNFKVVQRITGHAEVKYICLIGGLKKKQLYENAYADMMSEADLTNGSRAVINIVTEEHVGGVMPFFFKRTLTVSAYVIEFTH